MEKQLAEMPDVFVDKKQIDKALGDLNLLRSEVPAVREKLESGDFQSAYHAARNLCVRETLLYRILTILLKNGWLHLFSIVINQQHRSVF